MSQKDMRKAQRYIYAIRPYPIMKKIRVQTCPECGSDDLYYEAGLNTGSKYHCKKCDYIGAFIIEKDIFIDDTKEKVQKKGK